MLLIPNLIYKNLINWEKFIQPRLQIPLLSLVLWRMPPFRTSNKPTQSMNAIYLYLDKLFTHTCTSTVDWLKNTLWRQERVRPGLLQASCTWWTQWPAVRSWPSRSRLVLRTSCGLQGRAYPSAEQWSSRARRRQAHYAFRQPIGPGGHPAPIPVCPECLLCGPIRVHWSSEPSMNNKYYIEYIAWWMYCNCFITVLVVSM